MVMMVVIVAMAAAAAFGFFLFAFVFVVAATHDGSPMKDGGLNLYILSSTFQEPVKAGAGPAQGHQGGLGGENHRILQPPTGA